MTICNSFIAADRQSAVVFTDTAIAISGRSTTVATKYHVLGHLPGVLLFRGSIQWFMLVCQGVTLAAYRDFDELRDRLLPRLCRTAVAEHNNLLGPATESAEPELIAVGWSERVQGYAAAHFGAGVNFAPVDQEPGGEIRPAPPGFRLPPDPEPGLNDWIELALRQVKSLRAEHLGETGTGGSLVRILLFDGAVSVRPVATLEAA
jgi:hypothetical protein